MSLSTSLESLGEVEARSSGWQPINSHVADMLLHHRFHASYTIAVFKCGTYLEICTLCELAFKPLRDAGQSFLKYRPSTSSHFPPSIELRNSRETSWSLSAIWARWWFLGMIIIHLRSYRSLNVMGEAVVCWMDVVDARSRPLRWAPKLSLIVGF
jgi:hypothetical protein